MPALRVRPMPSARRTLLAFSVALALLLVGAVAVSWAADRSVAELGARWAPPPSQFIALQGMQVHVRDEGPRVCAGLPFRS